MNVTTNSQLLAAELRALNKIVPTKPTFEVLAYALLTTGDGSMNLYATDLEVALDTQCICQVHEHGQLALPVAKLLQMVEQFPNADVNLSLAKAQMVVQCGSFTSKLRVMPVEDFPQPPIVEGNSIALDAAMLRTLINRTRHAVSANATKYVLKGALLTCSGTTAAMVATEGKRLALATVGRDAGEDLRIVVPVKALDTLAEGSDEGLMTLTIGDKHMFFAIGTKVLTSRKLEGEFPKYERIVPQQNDKTLVADRATLTAALRRVILAAEENGAIYAAISEGLLELSAASTGIGSAYEGVQVSYEGQPLKVLISGEAVLDFLNSADKEAVTLKLKDEKTAALLLSGEDHVSVIMLMRP